MNTGRDICSRSRETIDWAHEDPGGPVRCDLNSILEARLPSDEDYEAEDTSLWHLAKEKTKLSQYIPIIKDNCEISIIDNHRQEKTYMLRNIDGNKYISMGEKEFFVWKLIDGQNSVADIHVEFLNKYGFIGDRVISNLLYVLRVNGFLQAHYQTMEDILAARVTQPTFTMRLNHAMGVFLHSRITTRRADDLFARLYHHGGHLLYNRIFFTFATAMLVVGLILPAFYVFVWHEPILMAPGEASSRDVIIFMIVSFFSLAIHESAHGLTVKHYGRQVLRAGFVVLLGYPIAYVDTTDVWMTGRGPRIAVSFAGPFINGVLGGALLLAAWLTPEGFLSYLLHTAGLLNSLLCVANLLPIIETDGHYIIQDWYEQPRLRADALAFVKKGAWLKLARGEKWNRLDFVFLAYGVIAVGGILYLLNMGIHLWFSSIQYVGRAILERPVMAAEILFFLAGIGLVMLRVKSGSLFREPGDTIWQSLEWNLPQ